jgi:hypothetical protein
MGKITKKERNKWPRNKLNIKLLHCSKAFYGIQNHHVSVPLASLCSYCTYFHNTADLWDSTGPSQEGKQKRSSCGAKAQSYTLLRMRCRDIEEDLEHLYRWEQFP